MATYVVEAGDTLGAIAARHSTTIEAIQEANSDLIVDVNVLQVGWRLNIPSGSSGDGPNPEPTPVEYVVRPGDTLSALAALWGTTVEALARMNDLANPNVLAVGQVLLRPSREAAVQGQGESQAARPLDEPAAPGELRFTALPIAMPPGRVNGVYLEQYPNGTHMGYDLGGVPIGTPIFAPAGGTVHVHRPDDGTGFDSFGICVVIDHPGTPYWTIYAHMDGTELETGATVRAGEVIGRLGWTGFVDPPNEGGAHLHWQVSNNRWFPKSQEATRDPTELLFGVTMPGVDDIPVPAGEAIGIDGELSGPVSPPDDGKKPGFE